MTRLRQVTGLIGWLLLAFATAAVGAVASIHAAAFYQQLAQPSWAPPPSVFGPVWSVLYAMMGVAAWLTWREGGLRRHAGVLTLFVVQLVVNGLWSWLFFAWHRGAPALVDIAVLWVLVVATMVGFWRVRPLAGALLAPYLAWISFATALNYAVWHLNPAVLG